MAYLLPNYTSFVPHALMAFTETNFASSSHFALSYNLVFYADDEI